MKSRIQKEFYEFRVLMRNVPATCMVFFVMSLLAMNLLANKELWSSPHLSLDCGIVMSGITFLAMDMLVKRFGAKASIEISLFAEAINLLFCGVLFLMSLVPQNWGEFYTYESETINSALNATIGGTWYVVVGSTIAFISSAVVNALINQAVGSKLTKDHYTAYAIRSFVSTFIGQFIDNLIFAYIVSINFFGWTNTQCIMCALTGAIVELICEIIFSPIGYRVSKDWKHSGIGREYLDLVSGVI